MVHSIICSEGYSKQFCNDGFGHSHDIGLHVHHERLNWPSVAVMAVLLFS